MTNYDINTHSLDISDCALCSKIVKNMQFLYDNICIHERYIVTKIVNVYIRGA